MAFRRRFFRWRRSFRGRRSFGSRGRGRGGMHRRLLRIGSRM